MDAMVRVPKDWAELMISAGPGEPVSSLDIGVLREAVEQNQGEPVGYQVRTMTDRPGSMWTPWRECCDATRARYSQEVGQFNQHGIMREIRPVFASAADPGELERLRLLVQAGQEVEDHLSKQIDIAEIAIQGLRAQLADLREGIESQLSMLRLTGPSNAASQVATMLFKHDTKFAALSASAEPSVPMESKP